MTTVIVAAGVCFEGGRVLLSQRKSGQHLAGLWEFPGGKAEEGEDPRLALVRELREELGIEVEAGEILDLAFHHYADVSRSVLLLFFEARRLPGSPEPIAREVAAVRWTSLEELEQLTFPPADLGIVEKVRRILHDGSRMR